MKSYIATVGVALTVAGLGANGLLAQQAPVKRNLDAEIQAALKLKPKLKLVRVSWYLGPGMCLLPQSGGENTTDNVPGYVTNPASAPARNTW